MHLSLTPRRTIAMLLALFLIAACAIIGTSRPAHAALANGYTKVTLRSDSTHFLDIHVRTRTGASVTGRIYPGGSWTGNASSTDTIGEPYEFNVTRGFCASQVLETGATYAYINGYSNPGWHYLPDTHVSTIHLYAC